MKKNQCNKKMKKINATKKMKKINATIKGKKVAISKVVDWNQGFGVANKSAVHHYVPELWSR